MITHLPAAERHTMVARTTHPPDVVMAMPTTIVITVQMEEVDMTIPGVILLVHLRREVVQGPLLLQGVHRPREEAMMSMMIAAGIRSDLFDPVGWEECNDC